MSDASKSRRDRVPIPSQEYLRARIDYDPETGAMGWKVRTPAMFCDGKHSAERKCNAFNQLFAGKPAMSSFQRGPTGEVTGLQTNFAGEHYQTARVIWKLVYGDEPDEIVALNGDLTDLRLENLKASSRIYTAKNISMFGHNTSGVRGVSWDKARALWIASIKANGRVHNLGRFTTIDRAASARRAAEIKLGFRQTAA